MSEGSNLPRDPLKNRSWLHSEPAARTLQRLREPVRSELTRLIDQAKRDISESTRRVLDYSSDSSSDHETAVHVITEREFEFGSIDKSLVPNIEKIPKKERRRLPSNSSISHPSEYGENSLTSYDSSIFDPEPYKMKKSKAPKPPAVSADDVDKEIERLRIEASRQPTDDVFEPRPGPSRAAEKHYSLAWDDYALPPNDTTRLPDNTALTHMMHELRLLNTRMDELWKRVNEGRESRYPNEQPQTLYTGDVDSEKRIEKARSMIPIFDGSNEEKLKAFLKACSYAYRKVHQDEENELTQAIICTKLIDRALIEVENRNLTTFNQLKETLEACYPMKKTAAQLQREFNNLRQKFGEDARAYGNRVERLSTEWFECATEGTRLSAVEKRTIHDFIKSQALTNYQLGLGERLQTIVRSRAPATLAEAISEAVAEERVKGFAGYNARPTNSRGYLESSTSRTYQKPISCLKCGKIGHLGRDCRTSRYATRFSLPKPEGLPRVNSTDKYCSYCRKNGHTREECWKLQGHVPHTSTNFNESRDPRQAWSTPALTKGDGRRTNRSTETIQTRAEKSRTRKIGEVETNHIRTKYTQGPPTTGLELVLIPVKE